MPMHCRERRSCSTTPHLMKILPIYPKQREMKKKAPTTLVKVKQESLQHSSIRGQWPIGTLKQVIILMVVTGKCRLVPPVALALPVSVVVNSRVPMTLSCDMLLPFLQYTLLPLWQRHKAPHFLHFHLITTISHHLMLGRKSLVRPVPMKNYLRKKTHQKRQIVMPETIPPTRQRLNSKLFFRTLEILNLTKPALKCLPKLIESYSPTPKFSHGH